MHPWLSSRGILTLLIAAGLFLRLHAIDRFSLWFDEAITVWKIHQPFSKLPFLIRSDTVPPLYYYILKTWTLLFAESDFSIRLLSALLGTAALLVIFLLGKLLFDRQTGLLAAFLLAVSTYHIQYSQEARSYSLLFLCFGISLYFLIQIVQSPRKVYWIGYTVSAALLVYSHGVSLVYLASLNVYFLAQRCTWKKRVIRAWVAANCIVLATFAPWLTIYIQQIAAFREQTQLPAPSLSKLIDTLILLGSLPPSTPGLLPPGFQTWSFSLPLIQLAWLISSLFLFLAPLLASLRNPSRNILSLYLLFVLPFAFIVTISLAVRSLYVDRLFVVCLIPLTLLLAASNRGSGSLNFLRPASLCLFSLCSLFSVYGYYKSEWKEDFRRATRYLVKTAEPGDVLLFMVHVGEIQFDWYSRGARSDLIKTGAPEGIYEREEPDSGLMVRHPQDLNRLDKLLRTPSRHVWFIRNRTYTHDPRELTRQWLDTHLQRVTSVQLPGIELICYRR
ncbi:MAG: glycosyltransferase family 39 protein [Acidobacteria bacterium]|nr:glycosyltransferase family 39 protein [Acidobacteriota bacterium]MCI0718493.1 glycosyltransferase family 39 protein [Acidobacteriota bacterium]